MGIKIWGNHCGPFHGKPEQPAIDKVDAACKRHDKGYGDRGYFDLNTDLALIRDQLWLQFSEDLTLEQRLASAAITFTFINTLPLALTATTARHVPDMVEGVAGQGKQAASHLKQAGTDLLDGIGDAGSAAVDTGKGVWRGITGLF